MQRVRHDDVAAFAELVEKYRGRVFGRLCQRLGDHQEAEDLTQDVFFRLYRSRKSYEQRAGFSTWLYHITQNVARDALRSRKRRPCVRMGDVSTPEGQPDVEDSLPDRGGPPPQLLEQAELAGQVRSAVSELGDRQRRALELHEFQGHTYAEVAAEMHLSLEAVKSLLHRARNQLRESLAALQDCDPDRSAAPAR
jgi:RNA polymerase sigma-70 factor (ECF subfamily)